jgi:hypothetical protein
MTDTVLARVRALKTIPIVDLKRQWRDLFGTDAPPYNRTYLESRLAYRIQEIEFGGLNLRRGRGLQLWLSSSARGGQRAARSALTLA